MSRALAATVVMVFFVASVHAQTYYSYGSYGHTPAKQYVVTISVAALEKSPAWRDDAENPPLSARKAIKLANEMKDRVVKDSDDHKWTFKDAALHPAVDGKWYWLVYYEFEQQQPSNGVIIGSSGHPAFLRLVVLMDGTVIKPVVRDFNYK
jgi:hypothetical protein